MTLLDPNPAQLKLIQHKIKALRIKSPQKKIAAFNKLIESGNFEKLFRGFRNFIGDFIWDYDHWKRWFKKPQQSKLQNEVFSHPYWPVAFELYFSDALLNTMFGPEATQYALKGSYPHYFKNVIEHGLQRNPHKNYFLHHIFLGHYLPSSLPPYLALKAPQTYHLKTINGFLNDVLSLASYDFIDLSNIFDWMKRSDVHQICQRLCAEPLKGTQVLWRQLNNSTDFKSLLNQHFSFNKQHEKELLKNDRSLFYSMIISGTKIR